MRHPARHQKPANDDDRAPRTGHHPSAATPAELARALSSNPGGPLPQLPADGMLALQRAAGNTAVARALARRQEEAEEGGAHGHHHADGGGHSHDPPVRRAPGVPHVLRSGGQPLPGPLREEMESRLGADFSHVQLHTGTEARRSATEIGARAYTSGSDVVIGEGGGDKVTIAHELIHVMQQQAGPVSGTDHGNGLRISDPGDMEERAAAEGAERAMRGPAPRRTVVPEPAPRASAATVQRAPASAGTWWFDMTYWQWRPGDVDNNAYRSANNEERTLLTTGGGAFLQSSGYQSVDALPAYVMKRFQQTAPAPLDSDDMGPELRMLNRIARIAYMAMPEPKTPHLAATVLPGSNRLGIAGNTGGQRVRTEHAEAAESALGGWTEANGARDEKDRMKFGALRTGHYGAHHGGQELGVMAGAVAALPSGGPEWFGLNQGGGGALHGEMALLEQHVNHWTANPNRSGSTRQANIGGVKLSCKACEWGLEAANAYFGAPNGYEAVFSGFHDRLYPGWITPSFLRENDGARTLIEKRAAERGGQFVTNAQGEYQLELPGSAQGPQGAMEPGESDSEWSEF
jgi:hypothetical protein